MTYDHWKTTNPDDEWLGDEPEDDIEPEPEEEKLIPSMCEPPDEQRRQAEERRRLDEAAKHSGDELIASMTRGLRYDSGGEWNFKHNKWGWE